VAAMVLNNTIQKNQGLGLRVSGKILPVVKGNVIEGNGSGSEFEYTDVNTSGEFEVSGNAIRTSMGPGVRILGQSQPLIRGNDLDGNGGYAVENQTSKAIDARNNWWGVGTSAEMANGANPKQITKIFDRYDDAGKGFVNYGGWLAGAANSVEFLVNEVIKVNAVGGVTTYWTAATDTRVAGYRVYWGVQADGTYAGTLDAGTAKEAFLAGATADQFIVVRGYAEGRSAAPTIIEGYQRSLNEATQGYGVIVDVRGKGTVQRIPVKRSYLLGEEVRLVATATEPFSFVNWTGAGATNVAETVVKVAGDVRTTANFLENFTLQVTPFGFGRVALNPTGGRYLHGTKVTMTPLPDVGHAFLGWLGDASGKSNPLEITMDRSKVIRANFANAWKLLVGAVGEGVVRMDPMLEEYPEKSSVSLIAEARAGWFLETWAGDTNGTVLGKFPASVTNVITVLTNGAVQAVFRRLEVVKSGEVIRTNLVRYVRGTDGKVRLTVNYGQEESTDPRYLFFSLDGSDPSVDNVEGAFLYQDEILLGDDATVRVRSYSEDFGTWVEHPPIQVVLLKGQSLSLADVGALVFRGPNPKIMVVSDSGLPSVVQVKSGPGVMEGDQLTLQGAGSIVLEARQGGNEVYAPAVKEFVLTVNKRAQTINFIRVTSKVYGTTPILLAAATDSGLTVAYKLISGSGVLTGNRLTVNGAGPIEVEASQAGNENYLPGSARQVIDIQKASQTVTFNAVPDQAYSTNPVPLVALASSKLPVSFEVVTSETARLEGTNLVLLGVGAVTVRARQVGNENYEAATTVDRTFQVQKGVQTIAFKAIGPLVYGAAPVILSATSSAGLPVAFQWVDGPGLVTNGVLVVTAVGVVNVSADQAGDAKYASATASQSVVVAKADQTLSFPALADMGYTTNGILLGAVASSGLSPSYRVVAGAATVEGEVLRLSGVGLVQVAAEQGGNTNWNASPSRTNAFTVSRGVQTVTFPPIPDQVLGAGPLTLNATSSSRLPVTYSIVSGKATVSQNVVTLLGEGAVTVLARQVGNSLWQSAQQERSFTVRKMASLSTTIAGNVGGSVLVDPKKEQYDPTESVTLTAVAGEGFVFAGWSGSLVGTNNPTSFTTETNRAVVATFRDVGRPALTWTLPLAGVTSDQQARLAGVLTDNVGITQASWRRDGGSPTALALDPVGGFLVEGISLAAGTNRFVIQAQDAAGNVLTEERVVIWKPERILKVADASDVQEGQRVSFSVMLTTPGDVAGLTFRLNYDKTYLTDPKVDLSAVVGQSVNSINLGEGGVISGSFSLAGTTLPVGAVPVATVSFRARSVPFALSTELAAEIESMSGADGSALPVGNATMSGWARIKPRRIKGDNNANQRVDIGDATVISRLQVGLEERRSWDVALNDLNGTSTIDNGDTVRALRIVVGMDPQPVATASEGKGAIALLSEPEPGERLAGLAKRKGSGTGLGSGQAMSLAKSASTTPPERVEWAVPSAVPVAGQTYTVQLGLKDITNAISGVFLKIRYPVDALRLENAQSHKPGAWVPTSSTLTLWNVGPSATNYATQDGTVTVAITSQNAWVGTGGVVAELTFRVQAGLGGKTTWPLEVSEVELTGSGYDNRSLSAVTVQVPGGSGGPVTSRKLSGKVEYYVGAQGGVPGVSLNMTEGVTRSASSAADGSYTIDGPEGAENVAVTVTPSLATDVPVANGVTTADITLIRRHVLGITPLDSPYKVLAGDVNGSDSVTTADITLIRRLILGIATNFSTGLWRFVPSDEAFSDPTKPWTASRMRRYASLAAGTLSGQDFKAIKLGDVNGSWKAPTVAPSSTGTAKSKAGLGKTQGRLSIGKVRAMAGNPGKPGKPVSIPVTLDGVDRLGSLQMTLSWDPATASFSGVTGVGLANLSPEHLELARVSEGLVSLSWDSPTGLPQDLQGAGELLRLDLVPKTGLAVSGVIGVAEQPTGLELTDGQSEVAATVSPGWWVIGSGSGEATAGAESVSLRIVPATGGTIRLEAIGPAGATLGLESSADLTTWTETQRLTSQGPGQPVSVTPAATPEARARFWRVRVR
jgi:hypothetical protein